MIYYEMGTLVNKKGKTLTPEELQKIKEKSEESFRKYMRRVLKSQVLYDLPEEKISEDGKI